MTTVHPIRRASAPAAAALRPGGWPRGLLLLWLTVLLLLPCASGAESISKEYKLKAAFIYNFTKFVMEWPPHQLAAKDAPIVIGILGKNPFGAELATIVQGRSVNGHAFQVQQLTSVEQANRATVVFVARGQESLLQDQLPALHAAGVLTIGESDAFGDLGGIINFTIETNATTGEDNIRFKINLTESEKSGLKFSSQLLKVAQIVRTKS